MSKYDPILAILLDIKKLRIYCVFCKKPPTIIDDNTVQCCDNPRYLKESEDGKEVVEYKLTKENILEVYRVWHL